MSSSFVEIKPIDIPASSTRDQVTLQALYDKLRVFVWKMSEKDPNVNVKSPKLMTKKNFGDSYHGYVYDTQELKEELFDEHDKSFQQNFHTWKSEHVVALSGFHTYGGYWAFFRPDIMEVLTLIDMASSSNELIQKAKAIFVTTVPYGDGDVKSCYNTTLDKHKGLTSLYLSF
jgi:hypothetical protein